MIHRKFALAAILLLSLSTLAHAELKNCAEEYTQIAQSSADKAHDRFTAKKYRELNPLENMRDWSRDAIMKFRGRAYPILAMDDLTPLKAKLMSKYALGEKTAFEGAPFDIKKISSELEQMLAASERYPKEFSAFLEDTATKAARLEGMERALAAGISDVHPVELQMPIIKMDADGKLTEVTMKPLTWANRIKFELELKSLRKEMEQRLKGPSFWNRKGEAYTLEALDAEGKPIVFDPVAHIYNVKKIETYRSEFRDHLNRVSASREAVVDPEIKPMIDRANAMFGVNDSLNKEFRPPYWVWKQLRWDQLKAEFKAAAVGLRVELWDKESTQTAVKFIKDMDPEERRALGLDKIAKTVQLWGMNPYVRTLWALGGTAVTGGGAVTYATQFWMGLRDSAIVKEGCASKKNEQGFRECAQDYLQNKFTAESVREVLFDEDAFLDNAGKIKDPKVKAEVLDIFQRRLDYKKNERAAEERKEALGKALKDLQSDSDPTSEGFRDKMIMAPRSEIFMRTLVSADDTQATRTRSYLDAVHPQQMKKNHETVLKILGEADPALRTPLLNDLRGKGAETLAKDLESIISDREDYMADPERYAARKARLRYVPPAKTTTTKDPSKDDKDSKDKDSKDGKDKDSKESTTSSDANDLKSNRN